MQADLELKIASVENLRPLKFAILVDEERRGIISFSNSDILAVGAWAGYCSSCKLNANAALTAGWVVCVVIEPDQIRNPVCMGVSGNDNVVPDIIIEERFESAVPVGLIPIPGIVLEVSQYAADHNLGFRRASATHVQRIRIPVCD